MRKHFYQHPIHSIVVICTSAIPYYKLIIFFSLFSLLVGTIFICSFPSFGFSFNGFLLFVCFSTFSIINTSSFSKCWMCVCFLFPKIRWRDNENIEQIKMSFDSAFSPFSYQNCHHTEIYDKENKRKVHICFWVDGGFVAETLNIKKM